MLSAIFAISFTLMAADGASIGTHRLDRSGILFFRNGMQMRDVIMQSILKAQARRFRVAGTNRMHFTLDIDLTKCT
jgi:hypothetical protein